MKKGIIYSVTALLIASILFLTVQSLVRALKGDTITAYSRFYKVENGEKSFNWLGLLSPLQVEGQNKITDTVRFTKTVIYPLAPKFQCVDPIGDTTEAYVAEVIAQAIADTVNKIQFNRNWDYDRQAIGVRTAAQPSTIELQKPTIELSLFGTASPEAKKYGFYESIQPGQLEGENADLAKQRLDRTTGLLLNNLNTLGIDSVTIRSSHSEELQFSETDMVYDTATVSNMLQGMRYVRADVQIPVERLEVTPITAPIAVPFWIGLLSLALMLLLNLPRIRLGDAGDWKWLWELLVWLLGIAALIALLILLAPYLFWLLIALMIVLFLIALYYFLRYFPWRELWELLLNLPRLLWELLQLLWKFLKWLLLWIAVIIYLLLFILWYYLQQLWELLKRLWRWFVRRPLCCKLFMLNILIDIVALVTWLLGLWHVCF